MAARRPSGETVTGRARLLLSAYLFVSLALPLGLLIIGAWAEVGDASGVVISAELWVRTCARALVLASIVGATACVAAYPLAVSIPAPILFGLFLVSPLARALGVLGLGLAPGASAVVVAQLAGALPLAGLLVGLRLRSVDPRWIEAGADLGASAWLRFRRITLPLIRPALATAGLWAALMSLGDIATLELAGGGKFFSLPLLLREVAFAANDRLGTATITLAILALSLPCASALLRSIDERKGGAARGSTIGEWRCADTTSRIIGLGALAIATLPLLGLALSIPGSQLSDATLTSLGYAIRPTLGGLPLVSLLATGLGFLLARRSARTPLWLGALVVLPLAMPSAVQGILVLEVARLIGAPPGDLLTFCGLLPGSLGLAFVGARLALASVPPELDEAARDLGADAWTRTRQLWLPLVGPAAAGVALIVLALNLGAVNIPAFTSGPGGSTLAIALTILARGGGNAAVGLVTLGLAMLPIVLVPILGRLLGWAQRRQAKSRG